MTQLRLSFVICFLLGTVAGCTSRTQPTTSQNSSLAAHSQIAKPISEDRFVDDDDDEHFDGDDLIEEQQSMHQRLPLLEANSSRLCSELIRERQQFKNTSKLEEAKVRKLRTDGLNIIGYGWAKRNFCKKRVNFERRVWQTTPGNSGATWPRAYAKSAKKSCRSIVKTYKKELKNLKEELAQVDNELQAAARIEQLCLAEAERRSDTRAAAAVSLSIVQIQSIPSRYRTPAETTRLTSLIEENQKLERQREHEIRQKKEAAAARLASLREEQRVAEERRIRERKAKEALLVEEHKADPNWMVPTYSAHICANQGNKREALKEIKTEKRYAKLGGIINKSKLYNLQQDIRYFDEKIASAKTDIRKLKKKMLPCTSKKVRLLTQCIWSTIETYTSPEIADRVSVAFGGKVQVGNRPHRGVICKDSRIADFVPLL